MAKKSREKTYELVIIGAGPAGITAAIYAARRKIDFLVISMDIGGQVAVTTDIENYTGYHFLSGPDLIKKFQEHLKDYKVNIKLREEVKNIRKKGRLFEIKTDRAVYHSKALVIASGKKPRKLGVPGEEKLYNKGVSYCALCDGPLFRDKAVVVVGGANSAIEAALFLEKYAKKVYVLTINQRLFGEKALIDKLNASKKIELVAEAKTTGILGGEFVEGLSFAQKGKENKIKVQGIFVEIGLIAGYDFAGLVKKNKWKEIMIRRSTKTNEENMTSVPGIFAAGDCTDIPAKQIIVAAGEGAKAAIASFAYLDRIEGRDERRQQW